MLRRLREVDMRAASGRLMCATVCRMFAMCGGGVLGGLRVDRLFGLLFFTACSAHEREATDQNKKRSHVFAWCPFCLPYYNDKMICLPRHRKFLPAAMVGAVSGNPVLLRCPKALVATVPRSAAVGGDNAKMIGGASAQPADVDAGSLIAVSAKAVTGLIAVPILALHCRGKPVAGRRAILQMHCGG